MKSRLGLFVPVVAAATLALGASPASAQTTATSSTSSACSNLHFELANPSAGSMLLPGGYVLEGIALDTRATSGPGIDRVDFFLNNRDEGGLSLGSAVPVQTAGALGPGSFTAILELPELTGTHDLFAYAHSTVTNQEAIIAVPISVGEDPTVAGATSEDTVMPTTLETCTPAPAGAVTTTPGATTPSTTTPSPTAPSTTTPSTTTPSTTTPSATTPPVTIVPGDTLTLEVANPSEGASLLSGAYAIEGTATDKAAQQGVGVDRVEVFWDNRDEGGLFLGSAIPGSGMTGEAAASGVFHVVVDLPENQTGAHSLWFYAHSSVTDTWTSVEIPVTIED